MDILNSSFFAAFFGAFSAAALAWWIERQRRLREEISACNNAISLSISVANVFLTLRSQRILPLTRSYEIERGRLFVTWYMHWTGQGGTLQLNFDLTSLQHVWVPIEALNKVISDRVFSSSRPAIILASLTQAVHNFRERVEAHQKLIQQYKSMVPAVRAPFYFGYPTETFQNTEFPDTIHGLNEYSLDCIYFGELLADVLNETGGILSDKLFGTKTIINKPDFRDATQLMPDRRNYSDFEKHFGPKKNDVVM